jgi:hypothetical protein
MLTTLKKHCKPCIDGEVCDCYFDEDKDYDVVLKGGTILHDMEHHECNGYSNDVESTLITFSDGKRLHEMPIGKIEFIASHCKYKKRNKSLRAARL